MKDLQPDPRPAYTIDQLVEALNHMRDACTRASLELRDIQFALDTVQRHQAMECVSDLVDKAKAK